MVQAEVIKSGSENALATIRKFSRKVQGTGIIKAARGGRYFTRPSSKKVKKKRALKLLKRRAEYQRLVKEGKIEEPARKNTYRESFATTRMMQGTPPIAH